jgi:hypothetical protein
MRNTPVHIGVVQRAIVASQTRTFTFAESASEPAELLAEPDTTKPTVGIAKHIAQGELLPRMIVAGDNGPVSIDRGVVPRLLAGILDSYRLATAVIFKATIFPAAGEYCFPGGFVVEAAQCFCGEDVYSEFLCEFSHFRNLVLVVPRYKHTEVNAWITLATFSFTLHQES